MQCCSTLRAAQIEIEDAERYRYDGECLIAAEEMGKPGLVEIRQKQDTFIFRVRHACYWYGCWHA